MKKEKNEKIRRWREPPKVLHCSYEMRGTWKGMLEGFIIMVIIGLVLWFLTSL